MKNCQMVKNQIETLMKFIFIWNNLKKVVFKKYSYQRIIRVLRGFLLLWIIWTLYHKYTFFLPQVRVLFSKGPFIAIFASDPHIIIKAINQNLNSVLRDSNINGHDYMRNIVHLPVFLNSRGLSNARKFLVTSTTNGDIPCPDTAGKESLPWALQFEGVT